MNAQTQASKNALHKSLERRHNASTSLAALWRPAAASLRQARPAPVAALAGDAGGRTDRRAHHLAVLRPRPGGADLGGAADRPLAVVHRALRQFRRSARRGRGKARADSLKAGSQGLSANKRRADGSFESVVASSLRKGDVVRVQAGEMIPGDGEVIEGVAAVNEAAITGESAPVIRESGGDRSAVTGNTQVVSDWLLVRIGANPGESTLDRMIALVEGAKRQKTPNEVALDILLIGLTLIFLLVVVTLKPFALFAGGNLPLVFLVALLVTLIPTTIGGLLSAIGIAGMDRLVRLNVIAKSGRAVEAAGDVHVLLLDKTGTITFGNRRCSALYAAPGVSGKELAEGVAGLAGRRHPGRQVDRRIPAHPASDRGAAPRGADADRLQRGNPLVRGRLERPGVPQGAVDAALRFIDLPREKMPEVLSREVDKIAQSGGTPLLVVANGRLLGAIHLKDVVKPGIRERFAELRRLGIRTVMVTGDNPLTAAAIAAEAGVDDVIAEATPEKKLARIRQEQGEGRLVAMCGDGANDAPALAQADVGMAMNDGTQAAREAANLVDLDSDPTKLLDVVQVGKELLVTRGALTTFSIANDVAKYFAILPALFVGIYPQLDVLNVMRLQSPQSAILSAIVFNALIIVALIPLALRGVRVQAADASQLLQRNLLIYGVGGLVAPFLGIKAIDLLLTAVGLA
ncbi:potassium-transporting ATPase subunit KdpB [Pseudomonas aeruginosa]|nr:potassium-transporting ATPase subunit KdpB [Pseudomonas aeruginosa]